MYRIMRKFGSMPLLLTVVGFSPLALAQSISGYFLLAGDNSGYYYSDGGSTVCGIVATPPSGLPVYKSIPSTQKYIGLCTSSAIPKGNFLLAGDNSGYYYS